MQKIYFITGNENKFREAKGILPDLEQLDLDLPEIQEIDPKEIIRAKIKEAKRHHQGMFIVEDVSFYLDCLKGENGGLPGPLIKWFLKTVGTEGIFDIANRAENSNARAVALLGLFEQDDDIHFFEGEIVGKVVSPRGDNIFGFDPIFVPNGYDKTFGEMTKEEKNKISHRKLALEKLKNHLKTNKPSFSGDDHSFIV